VSTPVSAGTPLRRATVAVVLNSNDHDHFTVSGEETFRRACPPWADPVFIADHDMVEKLGALLDDGGLDAVVFASNSLITRAARETIDTRRFQRWWPDQGPNHDVGVVVLHQFLNKDSTLPVHFLGSASFTLTGEKPRQVKRDDIRFRSDWLFTRTATDDERSGWFLALSDGYGKTHDCVWARWEFRHPAQWEHVAWEHGGEPLVSACTAGDRLVVACRAPIDLMGMTQVLGSLIASALRPRGCLLVERAGTVGSSAFTPALASAIERGRFVERHQPVQGGDIDPRQPPYHFFDELIVAADWPVEEITALDERAMLRKLESGGSVVATFTGPGKSPVTVRLHGQPTYAHRANRLASWFLPRVDSFKDDVWASRALAAAVVATRDAFEDERLIPQALRADYVRRHVAEPLAADRISNDCVDDNVLATAATYAALRDLGGQPREGMHRWLAEHLDGEPGSVVAQVLFLVPELRTPERLQQVRAAAKAAAPADDAAPGDGAAPADDDARLLRAYAAALFADTEPELLQKVAADASLGLGVRAELLRALGRSTVRTTDETLGLAAQVRTRIDRLAMGTGGLEAVCLGNAALIELGRWQGIGPAASVSGRPRELDARTIETTELVRMRDEAVRNAKRFEKAGKQATTLVFGLLVLVTIAAVAAVFLVGDGGFGDRVGLASTLFALLSGLTTFFVTRARKAGLPPWPTE
jgi:hypothetical protein